MFHFNRYLERHATLFPDAISFSFSPFSSSCWWDEWLRDGPRMTVSTWTTLLECGKQFVCSGLGDNNTKVRKNFQILYCNVDCVVGSGGTQLLQGLLRFAEKTVEQTTKQWTQDPSPENNRAA